MTGDVLIIGAGPSGLVAATYLARTGVQVVVLESASVSGGSCANRTIVDDVAVPSGPQAFMALDPRVIKELRLALRFAARDLPLVGLRRDGKSLVLSRDVHADRRAIVPLSQRDADRFIDFRREHLAFARGMRAIWWEEGKLDEGEQADLRHLRVASACAYLDTAFESDALKAAFAFDAMAGGLSPSAAGSSLVLAWQAAQEMCGLQGATAIALGGPAALVDALRAAAEAAGVAIRSGCEVVRLNLSGDAVSGAVLATGETVAGRIVLSTLSRRRTLVDFLPTGAAGFATVQQLERPPEAGEGKLLLALNTMPIIFKAPGRFVIAEKLDASAHAEARAGGVPEEPALEVLMVDPGVPPPFLLSVMIRPLPVLSEEAWKPLSGRLIQNVLRVLELQAPELAANVTGMKFVPPKPRDRLTVSHMLASWRSRIETPVRGLYMCGQAAEPVPAVSGRAARIAAAMVAEKLKEAAS